jgi:hypothetical protein
MRQIVIVWIGKDGEEISRTYTGDEDTPENRKDLYDYIVGDGDHEACTEGLDAPDGWDQYDMESVEVT